ncbi:hydrocephalus-inducing protein homolog [Pithys albifrons albifrons]|uniref:hydrocephalus-inducing protein homolog n=1 Tax=Pithys albifrons albifrons TaxID=3385563 RepID=UPI003A5CB30D
MQLFNKVIEAEITLQNPGKMGFTYTVLNPSSTTADCPLPGVPVHGDEKYEKIQTEAKENLVEDRQSVAAAVLPEPASMEPPTDGSGIEKQQHPLTPAYENYKEMLKEAKDKLEEDTQLDEASAIVELPAYILNMGSVIQGNVERHTVNITNTGLFPVSCWIDQSVLRGTGFSVSLDQVQCLPYCNTKRFEVLFDSNNVPFGEVDVLLPIKVAGGSTVHIHLYVTVTGKHIKREQASRIPWMHFERLQRPDGLISRVSSDFPYQSRPMRPYHRPHTCWDCPSQPARQIRLSDLHLTPSAFQKEMSLSTKQRLDSIQEMRLPQIVKHQDRNETSHHKFSAVDPDQTLFQPFPSEVVFQNYVPHKVYEVPVILRNMDKVPRLVKVIIERSPYFKLDGPSGVYHKVPPGLCSTSRILFTPVENTDYCHQLLCVTEREEFIVPIQAIGPRAVLDFPDQLDFSVCPVKYSTQKTLLVRNLGNREAHYQISTQSPFSVIPAMGTLNIGNTMQVTVEFHPLQARDHSASLVVHYDTGEDTHTSLHGSAVNVHIRLDRNSVTVDKTYLSLSNHSTVMIHNRSSVIARFQWKAFATQEREDREKERLCRQLCRKEESQAGVSMKWCRVDTTCQERLCLLSHNFQSERAKVQEDPMLFSSGIFTIEPVEGEVWPNSSAEINVIFKPQKAQIYKQTAYCDISGREIRLPLLLIGEGLGPQLRFCFEELDIGEVSVLGVHRYEAILCNKGPVEAPFCLIPPTSARGSCFTFLPQQSIIAPDGLQVIQISFRATILGKFKEEFWFSVTESPKPVTFTIRGCVVVPTFHFDVPALHFGDISFGFPHTLSCRLTTTSLRPMTFNLRIPEDGLGEPSTNSFAQISSNTHPSWGKGAQGLMKPREFTIKPCRGTIRFGQFQDIQVTLCSNTVQKYKMELVVDVDDVGKVLALPVKARCVVPPLRVLNPTVTFGRCCLKVPYEKILTLVNNSDFSGCYRVLPQEHKEDAAVWYSSPVPCGIIKAHSSVEIPFILEAQLLGEHDIIADVAVFGNEESPLKIHLESIGQGPVVHVYPSEINLGTIQVLQDISQTLHLSNQSVIPAVFRAEMAGTSSRWRTEPSKGVIPPKTEVTVSVTANLDGTGKFEDEVKLFIENSHTSVIAVRAVGIGTTIVTDKPFAPELNLKSHFSLTPCRYEFKLINKGRHIHDLYWTTEGFSIFQQHRATKGKKTSQSLRPVSPVFKLEPPQMKLMPGQTMEMVLEGFSNTPQEVKERLLCHALVGREKRKRLIMQVDVTCEFVSPTVQMSSRAIPFRVEKQPSDVLTLQYEPLSLKNTCSLPLSIVLDLKKPFLICNVDQQPLSADAWPMKLEVGQELHLCIQFNPAYKKDLNSRVAVTTLNMRFLEHPHEEQISIRGEVYFPNLHIPAKALDFGCIMNDTEQVRYVEMTNCSPIAVHYHWAFQTGSQVLPSPTVEPQSPETGLRQFVEVEHPALGVQEAVKVFSKAGSAVERISCYQQTSQPTIM